MTKSNDATGWYATVLKSWHTPTLGPKPTAQHFATVHGLGARPGKQALANAMALRDGGVTGAQIVMATGAPQLNKMRGFINDGVVKREAVPPANNGHTVYKLALTAKGAAKVKRAATAQPVDAAAPAKPAKVKQARKPAKPAPVQATPEVTASPQGDGAAPQG